MLSWRRELRTAAGRRGTCQLPPVPWRLEGAWVNPSWGRWLFASLLQPLEEHDSSLPQPPAKGQREAHLGGSEEGQALPSQGTGSRFSTAAASSAGAWV